ncbi:MAG: peptidylprolyl isomerase [Lachnospiraceae bacterium]|nr:peptidylprolyl isomerase [Lachnospiraceae bacterium]
MRSMCGTIRYGIAVCLLAAAVWMLSACGKNTGKNGTGSNTSTEPTEAVTPTPSWEEDETEPALRPEAQTVYQLREPAQGDLCAEFVIEGYGSIFVHLFSDDARKAVENFKTIAGNGNYDGIRINRVVADYMMQAGDKEGLGLSGESIYGGGFPDEITDRLHPIRGALCMANLGTESTNTNQFFFVQTKASLVRGLREPLDGRFHLTTEEYIKEAYDTELSAEDMALYEKYGGAPWLQGHNTVFGQIYDGYEVLDAVMETKVTSKLRPNPAIVIKQVRIFHYGVK